SEISNGAASSPTLRSPRASAASISRLVGSDRAWNTPSSWNGYSIMWLNIKGRATFVNRGVEWRSFASQHGRASRPPALVTDTGPSPHSQNLRRISGLWIRLELLREVLGKSLSGLMRFAHQSCWHRY